MQSAYARCTEAIVRAYADLTYSVLENVMYVLLLMLIDEGKMFWVNACIAHTARLRIALVLLTRVHRSNYRLNGSEINSVTYCRILVCMYVCRKPPS